MLKDLPYEKPWRIKFAFCGIFVGLYVMWLYGIEFYGLTMFIASLVLFSYIYLFKTYPWNNLAHWLAVYNHTELALKVLYWLKRKNKANHRTETLIGLLS